jgi:hypothetical protein
MKKILIILAVACLCISAAAQNLQQKVPDNASVVIKYAGENFSKNISLKKLDSYSFIKENLFKALKIDSLSSLQNLGINFEKDVFQYVTADDSATSFVTLFNLRNVPQFLQLVQANYQAEIKPEKKNGYEFLQISPSSYLGWNNEQAVLAVTTYQNPTKYYSGTTVDSAAVFTDSMAVIVDSAYTPQEEIVQAPVEEPVIKKPVPHKNKKEVAKKGKKGSKKKPAVKKKIEEPIEEVVEAPLEEITEESKENYHLSFEDSVAQAKVDSFYKEQEKISAAKQRQIADSIINAGFNGSSSSIENEVSYKKMIEPGAHVSVWLNYENLLSQYSSYFNRSFGWGKLTDAGLLNNVSMENNKGLRTAMNIYFEKEKMRVEQKVWSPDEATASLSREVYNSKQNPAMANYVNTDNVGYLSVSINTEAMANYYYKLIRQYLNNYRPAKEYADVVDVYMDLMEIIIDEKAIADLMPGNMLVVLHDMKTKPVTYTDYVYDEKDFKSKEVKRTKEELSPNFTFVMDTRNEAFIQKLVKLPLKYAKKENINYQEKGGYYELAFDKEKYPVSSLYFMVKEGKLIITTSMESITMTLNNKAFPLDAETKKSITKNNYSFRINSKQLIQQINGQLSTDLSKKISKYMEENIGDVKMESNIKDGMIQATTTMGITGNHANSLEFFFNMIDSINNIMEQDKLEREKKVD